MSDQIPVISQEMRIELRKDFPKEAYKKHPTKTFLTTLKAMYVTERLNDVFGIGRWTIEIEIVERTTGYVLVQGEFKSMDFQVIVPKQFGGHVTVGKNTEVADGFKSAVTDCQSKIASYLEIGIEMFKGLVVVGANPNRAPVVATTTSKPTTGKKSTVTITKEVSNKPTKEEKIPVSLSRVIQECNSQAALSKTWGANKDLHGNSDFITQVTNRKKILMNNGIDK